MARVFLACPRQRGLADFGYGFVSKPGLYALLSLVYFALLMKLFGQGPEPERIVLEAP